MSIVTLANVRRGVVNSLGSQPKKPNMNQGFYTFNMEESQKNSQNMSDFIYDMKTSYESGEMEHGILKLKEKLSGLDSRDRNIVSSGSSIDQLTDKRLDEKGNAPYAHLAKDGENHIDYNGVIFSLDPVKKAMYLGDMSNPDDVISIPLSGGGTFYLNRNSISSLIDAIDMFSPEDINRILDAISLDNKVQKMKNELEDLKTKGVKTTDGMKTTEKAK